MLGRQIRCIQGNPAYKICSSPKCNGLAILCDSQDCKCFSSHRKCLSSIDLNVLLNRLSISQAQVVKPLQIMIHYCDKIIKQFEIQKQSIISLIQKGDPWDSQRKLYFYLTQQKFQQINGDFVYRSISLITHNTQSNYRIKQFTQQKIKEVEKHMKYGIILLQAVTTALINKNYQIKLPLTKYRFALSNSMKSPNIKVINQQITTNNNLNNFIFLRPCLNQIGNQEVTIAFQVKQAYFVNFGVSFKETLQKTQYIWSDHIQDQGHGHMIHCDGHTSSVLDSQNNKTFYNFTVNNYDVIHMKYSGKTKELTMINTRDNEQITLKITNDKNMSMYLSVCMLSQQSNPSVIYLGNIDK